MIKGDKFILNSYEYKILDYIPNEEELNKLGIEGWELCGILNTDNKVILTDKAVFYFKRKCGELMTIREVST